MKYKAKFSAELKLFPYITTCPITENSVWDEDKDKGVFVFIPFTDQRFFEPIKTRTFQVEMSEENMNEFSYRLGIRGYHSEEGNDPRWTVTEITIPSWITNYKSSGCYNTDAFSTDELYTIDVEEFKDNYQYGNKLQGVKWLKDRFGKGLKESKELADFIFSLSV